jgi:phosphatidylglycerophosphate synthase
MEAQVGWGAAMILMALMAAHAAEELVAAGRLSCMEGCSAAARFKAWLGDRIGPLLLLVALALAGVLVHAFWVWLALGIVVADLAQHAVRSIRIRAYTPGAPGGAFLAVYVLSFIGGSLFGPSWARPPSWGAMVIGIAFVTVGYLSAQRKRLFRSQRPAGEP